MQNIWKWVRKNYYVIVNSIAFYPAIIAAGFLLLSFLMYWFDYSPVGKQIKLNISWISLKDASTARSVVSSIVAGIITLTVFSFSMVMIVLNQAASQMSNRILDIMISNRFQQFVLGTYIGTFVYALFLLTTIRDIQSGIYVPAISIYLLVVFMVVDIFLFIYFLHFVTQTVKYETIIRQIHHKTFQSLKQQHHPDEPLQPNENLTPVTTIKANETGYFQGYNEKRLMQFAEENKVVIEFLYAKGSYLIKGADMLITRGKKLSEEQVDEIFLAIDFFEGQSIDLNPYFGFQQLSEVAVKALSPGINDGATAVSSIHAMSDLFAFFMKQPNCAYHCDERKNVWIISKEYTFDGLIMQYLLPVWHFGKNDPFVQRALQTAIFQLQQIDIDNRHSSILNKLMIDVKEQMKSQKIFD